MNIIEEIKNLDCKEVLLNESLKKYNTYKVGNKVKCVVIPNDVNNLILLLKLLRNNNIQYKIIGFGSNLIFVDNDYDGILIKLDNFNELVINDTNVFVGSGYALVKLALLTANLGLSGLEFASGIPGTVGGAIYMNAGAYNSSMSDIVESVQLLTPNYEIVIMSKEEMQFKYRESFITNKEEYICLGVNLRLNKSNKEDILNLINDRRKRRLESQPLEYPNAGSVFRNPLNNYAGKLIEDLGYKGYSINGATVSNKHANFIINTGNATGQDIVKLIIEIKNKVKEQNNIDLLIEQEFVDNSKKDNILQL